MFRAFRACAASRGCMSNFTFGLHSDGKDGADSADISFGYYETIAGGSGAGPSWSRTSSVHTNMTNTRITDPESLERRYPVVLRRYNGGDGVIRDVEFPIPMSASILSERRSFTSNSLAGGGSGRRVQGAAGVCSHCGGKCGSDDGSGRAVLMATHFTCTCTIAMTGT